MGFRRPHSAVGHLGRDQVHAQNRVPVPKLSRISQPGSLDVEGALAVVGRGHSQAS